MCGIAGILNLDGRPVAATDVRLMCETLAHRGPDDAGFFVDREIGLGMRRLSIIDLHTGHQPVTNEDGTVWVVFNGEIYNFQQLRRELLARGHALTTRTDTEVIVHLYEDHGAELVHHLRGMFAFALWDARRKQLLLGRDRLGIKPLYYGVFGDRIIFASELKAILAVPGIDRELDFTAVNHLFTTLTTPPGQSIVQRVRKLEPAHVLTVGADAPLKSWRYWDVTFEPNRRASRQELIEQLRDKIDECVRMHMVSDVPVGAFLSGGIDSSAVVAHMVRHSDRPVKTFAIGFNEQSYNELPYARLVARTFATDHHEAVVEPDVMSELENLVWHLDEPFGDSSAIPTYMVSRLAADHVKVVLSGDGGDELFAGYDRYGVERRQRRYPRLPGFFRDVLRRVAVALPEGTKGRSFAIHHTLTGWDRYLDAVTLRDESRRKLLHPDVVATVRRDDLLREAKARLMRHNGHWLSSAQYFDLHGYLPLDILTKVDRMSMAHSLEARVPLLDHKLVEFAATIPPELALDGDGGKRLFKTAMRGIVPVAVVQRPKQGFAIPLAVWFRGELEAFARDLLLSRRSRERNIVNSAYVETLLALHRSGRSHELQLWTLISFELWCRMFLDRQLQVTFSDIPRRAAVFAAGASA